MGNMQTCYCHFISNKIHVVERLKGEKKSHHVNLVSNSFTCEIFLPTVGLCQVISEFIRTDVNCKPKFCL